MQRCGLPCYPMIGNHDDRAVFTRYFPDVPVDQNGFASEDFVAKRLSTQTRLVCLMLGNNETGTMQPVQQIAKLCRNAGVPVHCDAVQVVGKLPLSFGELGVSTLSFSAHKFHGPRGAGGLAVKKGINLQPLLVGGSQQLGIRPGTESVALAAGMAKALEISQRNLEQRANELRQLRDQLQETLVDGCSCCINGVEPRLPHTLNVSFAGIDRQALVMALDLAGVECSTGSACTSGSSEPSHVLEAMGLETERIASSIRFSLGAFTTASDVAEAGNRILEVVGRLAPEK
jgi:cysteine desulfurase